MPENKTQPTAIPVADFIAAVPDPVRRGDAEALVPLLEAATGEAPRMWGPSIIGFGSYHYRYDSGREGDAPRVGFSPRKAETVLYLADAFPGRAEMLARLGKHRAGVACVYIKRLSDIDMDVLRALVAASLAHTDAAYPPA
ncbi:DUF1801 domain-containing protein [Sphingomonas donggukensis]|uniref:DUF1801 domain-containing protein n=1 Tax=Sphingomonas donggukensis TaxID=2949093 RepID=A0ABY4TW22_9SPHN|nr:DUF1801 domain-containing protein [Sphingomonas donggukensis]URW75702.1 DUF1801 domain-containing protein [Sphingomonas donggukensis]